MPEPTRGFDYWQRASRGNGKYVDPDSGNEIKFAPQAWELNGGEPRKPTGGQVPSTHDQAPRAGYKLAAIGVPCPIDGCEGGTVYYDVKGKPAIWDDGRVYVKESK